MPTTMEDVLAVLTQDEVDYSRAQQLGSEAVPFLDQLVRGEDLNLASKAAYLASMIESDQSTEVLAAAAARPEPVVRVAAASGIRNLSDANAERMIEHLQDDADPGVRKVLVSSAAVFKSPRLVDRVRRIAEHDPEPFVRASAARSVERMR
jgi:HEAT repeat protein